jgi:23S rRNA (cytidine2498-2'-O)-methyltransferase
MALITDRLPPVKACPLIFPQPAPTSHLGGWTLRSPAWLLASPTKTSPFVNGEWLFAEDRTGPPSRAYLKLWEACVRFGAWPAVGERCLDPGPHRAAGPGRCRSLAQR